MRRNRPEERIVIALDVRSLDEAERIVQDTGERAVMYKVGSELFTRCGPAVVHSLIKRGKEIFLDLKFHDIPNTVGRAVAAAAELGVKMLNVHASGGVEMMRAAAQAAKSVCGEECSDLPREASQSEIPPVHVAPPKVLAVTVLTSIDQTILTEDIGCRRSIEEQVLHLAKLAAASGLDGVVASPREIAVIRRNLGSAFLIVTPGIRPEWSVKGDQKRVTTPAEAIRAGADYIVVGRPITASPNPKEALERIVEEISEAYADDPR